MGLFDFFKKQTKQDIENSAVAPANKPAPSANETNPSADETKAPANKPAPAANETKPVAMSEIARKMVERYGYAYTVFEAGTDYDDIMAAYQDKLNSAKAKGLFPVIVPVDDILEDYWDILDGDGYSVEDAIKAAAAIDGKSYLDQCFRDYGGDSDSDGLVGDYDGPEEEIDRFTAFKEFGSMDSTETIIFEVPTTNPWEVPAYLPFGGWNDCPAPDKMVAACKYFFEKYGAVPVTITHDVMEMSVPECVSQSDALELAKQHYGFCMDRVMQGTRTCTISEVAASLAVSKIWYFWWD